ncbi:MAG: hypothetical protein II999_03345 [Bacteroidaceae bacterium]|nr:hypothetical protein [Bacteroidaceae bacterium]
MKSKLLILLAVFYGTSLFVMAQQQSGGSHRLNKEEFKEKFQQFLIKQADLSEQEAKEFFPVYDECQKKKHELNGRIWKLRKEAHKKQLTEEDYKKILDEIADLRIQIDKLDKEYLPLYRKTLSYKKIFDIQGAESRFHRELLKEVNHRPRPKK